MRISSYAVARPAYYDRNAVGGRQRYVATVAPHAQTTRWTVTIAAGKKCFVEQAAVRIGTTTLPTVGGLVGCGIDTYDGTTYTTTAYSQFTSNTTTLQYGLNVCPTIPTVYAGESITAYTVDNSTGGTVQYIADTKYTIFDQ